MLKKLKSELNKLDYHWSSYFIGFSTYFFSKKIIQHEYLKLNDPWSGIAAFVISLCIAYVVVELWSIVLKLFGLVDDGNSNDLANAAKSIPKELNAHAEEDPQATHYNASAHGQDNRDRYIGPLKSLELFFKNYTDFSGRSSRSSFWWWQLFDWVLISTILQVVDVTLHSSEETDWFYHPDIGGVTQLLWFVVTLVPLIALPVRRLHDTNRSGWWLLLSVTIIGIIPLIIWFCSSGTRGRNTYGADKEAGL